MPEPGGKAPQTPKSTKDEPTSVSTNSVVGNPEPSPTPPDPDGKDKKPRPTR